MPFGEAGRLLGVHPNSLRYAAPTGTILLHWDGARQPAIWWVDPPQVSSLQARLELARRYLHIFGPGSALSFARWAGVSDSEALDTFRQLGKEIGAVRTPVGERWFLASDEDLLLSKPNETESTRLLPSGDAFYLTWGEDRTLLVPDSSHRAALWTSRVWPGALFLRGELAGTWRRSALSVTVTSWKRLTRREKESVEVEAQMLPVADKGQSFAVLWT